MRAQDEGPVLPPELAAFLATTFELSCSTLLTPSSVLKLLAVTGQDMVYKHYSIGQLARAAGVPISTLRYYERVGLLAPAGRAHNNYRLYTQDTLQIVRFIRAAQATGFTLEDVRTFLTLWDGQSAMCKDVQAFFVVYVQEAHPTDGWQTDSNVAEGILFRQHQSYEEREAIATTCSLDLHLSMPVLVEEMDNAIDEAYGAAPERLYLIGVDGRGAYHGGAGPHFFDLEAWEQAIAASVHALGTP